MKRNDGYSTFYILITIMLICVFLSGLTSLLYITNNSVLKEKKKLAEQKKCEEVYEKIISDLVNNQTTEYNSKKDAFWQWNGKKVNGCKVSLDCLSGKADLNFLPVDYISKTGLRNVFLKNETIAEELKNREHLFFSYDELDEKITEENFDKYFTLYGWANFNIADQESLELLLKEAETPNANLLLEKRKSLYQNKQYSSNYTDLRMQMGVYYKNLLPLINLEPMLNVNFIDEDLMNYLFSYPLFGIGAADSKIKTIIEERESKGISDERLRSILSIDQNSELYYLLGTKTYFYQIDIETESQHLKIVIAREISDSEIDKKNSSWYIMEKSFL